jgi:hypothetical protein
MLNVTDQEIRRLADEIRRGQLHPASEYGGDVDQLMLDLAILAEIDGMDLVERADAAVARVRRALRLRRE